MADQPADTPVLDLLAKMTADSVEVTSLDDQSLMLARLAALVAIDAPPASYLLNLGAAGETGLKVEHVQGVLTAVAPIVGTPRVVAASSKIVRALGVAIELAQLEELAELEELGELEDESES